MAEQAEFFAYARDEFLEELVHPDDRAAVEDERAPGDRLGDRAVERGL